MNDQSRLARSQRRPGLLVVAFFLFVLPNLHAEVAVRVGPLIWGAQVRIETDISPDDYPRVLGGSLGAAFGSTPYLRGTDGTPFRAGELSGGDIQTASTSTFLGWNADISQAILLNRRNEPVVSVFAGYWGRLDNRFDEQSETTLFTADPEPDDVRGQLLNSLRAGLQLGRVRSVDDTPVLEGLDAELTFEWAPEQFLNTVFGNADFTRVSARARGFVPVRSGGGRHETRQTGVYAGAHVIGDYTRGSAVPILVRSSFGGRFGRSGLAGTVRGYESGRFDSVAKAAAGAELRIVGPQLGGAAFMPGLVLFTDAGYYSGFEGADSPSDGESGWIASSGLGASVTMFNAVTLVFYSSYVLADELLTGGRLNPLSVGFGYHF